MFFAHDNIIPVLSLSLNRPGGALAHRGQFFGCNPLLSGTVANGIAPGLLDDIGNGIFFEKNITGEMVK